MFKVIFKWNKERDPIVVACETIETNGSIQVKEIRNASRIEYHPEDGIACVYHRSEAGINLINDISINQIQLIEEMR